MTDTTRGFAIINLTEAEMVALDDGQVWYKSEDDV
jgi:hypothetical protein